jgi:hypothetical protein
MKKVIIYFILFFIAFNSNAQLVYENTGLVLNGTRYQHYTSTWCGGAHAWYYDQKGASVSNPHVFRVILDSYFTQGTQISSNRGAIYFYDDEKSTYNTVYAKNFYTASDLALKTNIAPLGLATKTVLALRPVSYRWNDQSQTGRLSANLKELGFIAQEVESVLPDVVTVDHVGNKLINYIGLIPVLTAPIQELNARVEELEKQLNAK